VGAVAREGVETQATFVYLVSDPAASNSYKAHIAILYGAIELQYNCMMALKFATFSSEIELPFYSALSTLKIDHDRLEVAARHVLGLYEAPISVTSDSCRMQVLGNALTSNQ
jgi:hypothetical protein